MRKLQCETAGLNEPFDSVRHDLTNLLDTITDDDKTNFKTTVETGGFKIANGDWLGWVETNYKFRGQPMCLDNVIVSDNVIFDSIISHSAMLDRLYSDHVPFEVTVTLLDA